MRLLLDLIRPTTGTIELFGMDLRRHSVQLRRRIGYLPGELALYEHLTGAELLAYLGGLRGGVDRGRVAELAERLDLDLSRYVHDLSRGNKQKLGLVQALMHRPELAILDEPTSGLDPLVQREFHVLVQQETAAGRTLLLSSHVLSEVERMAHRVGIVRQGQLVDVQTVPALKARALRRLELDLAQPVPTATFAGLPGVRAVTVAGTVLRCEVTGSVAALISAAAPYGVVNVVSAEPDLEEVFLAYYEDIGAEAGKDGVSHAAA